jgi:uncharacterized phage-associated protein
MADYEPNEPTLDKAKLLDAVHYIAAKCDTSELGNVKLHKILYFADMLHFVHTGRPLTGVQYLKQKFGPCARHLSWATQSLAEQGRVKSVRRNFFGFTKVDYFSIQPAKTDRLGNMGISILDECIAFVCKHSAKEISELSHTDAWDAVQFGETIPYATAYWLQPVEVTDDDVAIAEGILRTHPAFAA